MSTANYVTRSITHPTHRLVLFFEWFFLLGGVLLCLPTKRYFPGLYLALFLLAVSWAMRWVRIRRLSRSTPLDVPLLLFLFSLIVSYFAAPLPETAFTRLTLFMAAFSVFYALVNSPTRSIHLVLTLLIILLAFTSLILISQYDWLTEVSRFSLHEWVGVQLNRLVPSLNLNLPAWDALRNILASLLGLSLPLLFLQLYRTYNQAKALPKGSRDWKFGIFNLFFLLLMGLLVILDLLLTESRAPWLIYIILVVLTLWWWLSRRLGERFKFSQYLIFLAGCILGLMLTAGFINVLSRNSQLVSLLPGPDTFSGRLVIASQSIYLAGDTPYTGGGLGAFTPLYSFYIRGIPFDAFFTEDTGNSLYLYILVEQGWLGLLILIFLLLIPLYHGLVNIDRSEIVDRGLVAAGLAGIGLIILRSFIHALVGASRAIPFFLLPAGLIFAGIGSTHGGIFPLISAMRSRVVRRRIAIFAIPIFLLMAYLLLAPAPRSAWYANQGAIRMARVQLTGWPTEDWEDGSSLPALAPAEALFQKSLALNPSNRTANHRMGLISLLRQDFPAAAHYLEIAYEASPQHRGVIKSLGYALAWTGELERATELLRAIPEAADELGSYISWWQGLGRADLMDRAAEVRARLLANP